MAEIMDFTDYAKPFDFKYREDIYRIPAFGKKQIEVLMQFGKKFGDEKGDLDELADDELVDDKVEDGMFFIVQDEFLACAILKKNAPDDVFIKCNVDDFIEWPIKLKNKIMKHINDQMSAVTDEEEVSKKS